jgi:hypothetical protein
VRSEKVKAIVCDLPGVVARSAAGSLPALCHTINPDRR